MHTRPLHHVSSFGFRIFSPRSIVRNEPNFRKANSQKWNPPRRTCAGPKANSQKMRNEPNSRTAGVSPAFPCPEYQGPRTKCGTSARGGLRNAKRTQFYRTPAILLAFPPPLRKTNPIPQAQLPKANSQHPKNAKRTQSQPGPPIYELPTTNYELYHAKQSQFLLHFSSSPLLHFSTTPLLPLPSRIVRNEPNLSYRWRLAGFPTPTSKRSGDPEGSLPAAGRPLEGRLNQPIYNLQFKIPSPTGRIPHQGCILAHAESRPSNSPANSLDARGRRW